MVDVCDVIDNKCRDFCWGDNDYSKKVHLLCWEEVCVLNGFVGIAFRSTRVINQTYMVILRLGPMI
jgi:hypothetical protein